MNIGKLRYLEKILNKCNHIEVYISYDGEEYKPGMGEVVICVKEDHYHIYTSERKAKHNVRNFRDEDSIILHIATLLSDDEEFYEEITNYLVSKDKEVLINNCTRDNGLLRIKKYIKKSKTSGNMSR